MMAGGCTGQFRAVKSASAPVARAPRRPFHAPGQARSRDWTILFALGIGLVGLLLMALLLWL